MVNLFALCNLGIVILVSPSVIVHPSFRAVYKF